MDLCIYAFPSHRAVYEKFKDGTVKDISDDIPFEIPEGWAWVRWKEISLSVQHGYSAPARQAGRIKMVRITASRGLLCAIPEGLERVRAY